MQRQLASGDLWCTLPVRRFTGKKGCRTAPWSTAGVHRDPTTSRAARTRGCRRGRAHPGFAVFQQRPQHHSVKQPIHGRPPFPSRERGHFFQHDFGWPGRSPSAPRWRRNDGGRGQAGWSRRGARRLGVATSPPQFNTPHHFLNHFFQPSESTPPRQTRTNQATTPAAHRPAKSIRPRDPPATRQQ